MCMNALVASGWTESSYYDKRKDYMLKSVDDSYHERSLGSKMASADDQNDRSNDGEKLRDDRPKRGEAVTLDRLADLRAVTDADLAMIESQALLDPADVTRGVNNKFKEKYPTGSSSLAGARSVLGRAPGQTPNVTYTERLETDEWGVENKVTEEVKDFHLSAEERQRLKGMDRRALLDKFYGTDTSKF